MTAMPSDRVGVAAALKERCARAGSMLEERADCLGGEHDEIVARWFLGGRRVRRVVRCELDAAALVVRWHERFEERTWGIAPPTMSVERTATTGKARSGKRHDVSVGGGGTLAYGAVREAAEAVAREAGWRFELKLRP